MSKANLLEEFFVSSSEVKNRVSSEAMRKEFSELIANNCNKCDCVACRSCDNSCNK